MPQVITYDQPRVLVVEDELLIALTLADTVTDAGYTLEGPFADKRKAFMAICQRLPDCAILDVHVADGDVFPLADALAEAGVPIIFHSGHATPAEMKLRYPGAAACQKPCRQSDLVDMLHTAIAGKPHPAH